jgi:hypothetical protein
MLSKSLYLKGGVEGVLRHGRSELDYALQFLATGFVEPRHFYSLQIAKERKRKPTSKKKMRMPSIYLH